MKDKLEDLVRDTRGGDEEAFRKIYTYMYPQIYCISFSILKDEHLAQDAVQETFVSMLVNIDGLKSNAAFTAWIKRIAYNVALQMVRKAEKNPIEYKEELWLLPEKEEGILERIIKKEEQEELVNIVMGLPPASRQIIFMRYYGGLKMAEIASIVNCPVGTVKSRLNHAKKVLRRNVKDLAWPVLVILPVILPGLLKKFSMALSASCGGAREKIPADIWRLGTMSAGTTAGAAAVGGIQAVSVSAAAAAPGLLSGAIVTAAGLMLTVLPVKLVVEGYQGAYVNQPVTITVQSEYPLPISRVTLRREGAEIKAAPDVSGGISAAGEPLQYKAVIDENGFYEVEVITADGRQQTEKFYMSRIDMEKPEIFWYSYDFDRNILNIYAKDRLSGLNTSACVKVDSQGRESPPLSWDETTRRMVFDLDREPFTVLLADQAGNSMKYQGIPYQTKE